MRARESEVGLGRIGEKWTDVVNGRPREDPLTRDGDEGRNRRSRFKIFVGLAAGT